MQDFILPDIGEGIVECEVVKWLVAEGQHIVEDQPVVEVMTDKALVEIPAKYSGLVTRLYYAQGDIAKVHSPLFCQQLAGDEPATQSVQAEVAPVQPVIEQNSQASLSALTAASAGKSLASPAVRRLAREMEIDLALVAGSGDKGRVLKQDLSVAPTASTGGDTQSTTTAVNRTEPIRGIKAAMAKQMSHSVSTLVHFTVSDEVQLDNLMAARGKLTTSFEAQGQKLSLMPFFIKALSMALTEFPIINSQVNQQCTELTYLAQHNIGLAVDSKIGLVVPNIKDVQNLSLLDIAKQYNHLIQQARQGKLNSTDLRGGTISISNIGVLGGILATPIINAPESAIVALGKIQRLPRFDENDQVIPANIMQVSWSGDHRIIDGATMVRFNNAWKRYLENPIEMLASLK